MTVALLSLELFIAGARSLKDKRMVLRRLKDRLAAQNVAVAEVADDGLHVGVVEQFHDLAHAELVEVDPWPARLAAPSTDLEEGLH